MTKQKKAPLEGGASRESDIAGIGTCQRTVNAAAPVLVPQKFLDRIAPELANEPQSKLRQGDDKNEDAQNIRNSRQAVEDGDFHCDRAGDRANHEAGHARYLGLSIHDQGRALRVSGECANLLN